MLKIISLDHIETVYGTLKVVVKEDSISYSNTWKLEVNGIKAKFLASKQFDGYTLGFFSVDTDNFNNDSELWIQGFLEGQQTEAERIVLDKRNRTYGWPQYSSLQNTVSISGDNRKYCYDFLFDTTLDNSFLAISLDMMHEAIVDIAGNKNKPGHFVEIVPEIVLDSTNAFTERTTLYFDLSEEQGKYLKYFSSPVLELLESSVNFSSIKISKNISVYGNGAVVNA